jgi:excisionase family DNA binding protein
MNTKYIKDDLTLLTLSEAAEILQVSKRTLVKMVRHKEVPAFKLGGQWRVRESQLKKWIELQENSFEPFEDQPRGG